MLGSDAVVRALVHPYVSDGNLIPVFSIVGPYLHTNSFQNKSEKHTHNNENTEKHPQYLLKNLLRDVPMDNDLIESVVDWVAVENDAALKDARCFQETHR